MDGEAQGEPRPRRYGNFLGEKLVCCWREGGVEGVTCDDESLCGSTETTNPPPQDGGGFSDGANAPGRIPWRPNDPLNNAWKAQKPKQKREDARPLRSATTWVRTRAGSIHAWRQQVE